MTSYSALRRFNENGLDAFAKVFTGQIDDDVVDPTDPALTSLVQGTKSFAIRDFPTTKDMTKAVLSAIGTDNLRELLSDTGFWAWLTFVMRDQLFRKSGDGTMKVGEVHRWYPSNPGDWQKGQRHLVRMPVLLLETLGDSADHLLCGTPAVLPEIREQLTSQQDMFNSTFQKVARMLYFNDATGALKRGAGGKSGGTPRRLAKVRQQLDVTWDLEEREPSEIIAMLPAEFSRFKPDAPSAH